MNRIEETLHRKGGIWFKKHRSSWSREMEGPVDIPNGTMTPTPLDASSHPQKWNFSRQDHSFLDVPHVAVLFRLSTQKFVAMPTTQPQQIVFVNQTCQVPILSLVFSHLTQKTVSRYPFTEGCCSYGYNYLTGWYLSNVWGLSSWGREHSSGHWVSFRWSQDEP